MNKIITQVFGLQYYKINTGFFLTAFILLFGLLNGKASLDFHHFIMCQITGSYTFFIGAVLIWSLYTVKCISFTLREIKNPANNFLSTLKCVSNKAHYSLWVSSQALLMAPMLTYAAITMIIGISNDNYFLTTLFTIFQLLLCTIPAYVYYQQVSNTWKKPLLSIPDWGSKIRKGYYSFHLHYALNTRKGTLIGIKALSLLLLQAMVLANAQKVNKESVCFLMMFLISTHALLPRYFFQFTEHDMAFTRNLPLTITKRFTPYVITYAILLLPELIFLLLNGKHTLSTQLTVSLYMVGISQLALFTSLQYFTSFTTERYLLIVVGFFFASLLFLASFNLWLLFAIESITAALLFRVLYQNYEYSTPKS